MHVHLLSVAGAGMGSLAILFREAGHDVSGSDVAFDILSAFTSGPLRYRIEWASGGHRQIGRAHV